MENAFQLDDQDREVLIGLSFEETEEYLRLEAVIARLMPAMDSKEWRSIEERRWLELYQKHIAAVKPFLEIGRQPN